jgi:hypothetical protein
MDFVQPHVGVAGPLGRVRRAWDHHRTRSRADEWIARGHDNPRAWYGWRLAELTSVRERRLLAGSLRGLVEDLSPRALPGAVPLRRAAVRPHVGLLHALAGRLDDLELPVRAAGVLLVHRLLTSPGSPLYADGDVGGVLAAALEALEVE